MRIKYLVLNILIPVCFVTGLYSVYLCVGSLKHHKTLLQYAPPKPESMQLLDSLEDFRQKYFNMRYGEVPIEVQIKMALVHEKIDSITHSELYLAEYETYQATYQRFLRRENRLTIKYIIQVALVVLGLGGSFFLSKRLYALYKSEET
jgi:hypothetical protein